MPELAYVGLWLFAFIIPWDAMVMIPNIGTIGRLAGMGVFGFGLFATIASGRIRRPHPFLLVATSFVFWTALSSVWSVAPEVTLHRAFSYVQLAAIPWLLWILVRQELQVVGIVRAYVLGTLVSSVSTIAHFVNNSETYYQRFVATGFDPNELAVMLSLSIPMSLYLIGRTRSYRKTPYLTHLLVVIVAILLTASRTGVVAALIAFGFLCLAYRAISLRNKLIILFLIPVMLVVMLQIVPSTSWERLSTTSNEALDGSFNGRTVIWNAGWETFSRSPFVGIGSGAYGIAIEPLVGLTPEGEVFVAHNTFLSILVEDGVVGFLLFLGLLGTLVACVCRLPARPRALWGICLFVWVVGASTLSWEGAKATWLLLGMVLAHSGVSHPRA